MTENSLKEIYLKNDPKPALSFSHKGAKPFEIAEAAKKKKHAAIIFEENVAASDIIAIITAVKRKMNGNSPKFIHIHTKEILVGVEAIPGHDKVLATLAA